MYIKSKYFLVINSILTACLLLFLAKPVFVFSREVNNYVPNQVLIKLRDSQHVYKLNLSTKENLKSFIKLNQANKSLAYIEPNYIYQATLQPNDTYYTQQIYLSEINAQRAWNYSTGRSDVIIAVIDSGVDIDHPDLKNNLWHNINEIPNNGLDDDHNGYVDDYNGWDFVSTSPDPRPKFGGSYSYLGMNHGTIVAGVAAAEGNNRQGITGVTWHAKIMPLRVLDSVGSGNTLNVAQAINYAVANGADIINLSFVGSGRSLTLEQAIQHANQAGVLVVAAAGNEVNHGLDMSREPEYPVCHDGGFNNNWVIGVASLDNQRHLASFSNYGNCVDLAAPGVGIFSTLYKTDKKSKFNHLYGGYWSGTSVSAPQVSGLAALIKSFKPDLNLAELKEVLLNSAVNIDYLNKHYIGKLGHGEIDAQRALLAAQSKVTKIEHTFDDLVIGAGEGGGPHVRVYTHNKLKAQFFALAKWRRHGIKVYTHDFNHDGRTEIIAYANRGSQPIIKIYDLLGNLKNQFYAFDKKMLAGLNLAVGDLRHQFKSNIVVVPESGPPLIKIFSSNGKLESSFYAFNKFYKGGLNVAVGDVNHDGFDEIIVATGRDAPATVKIFNYRGQLISQFMPYGTNYMSGVTLSTGDIDGDGLVDIITGTRVGGGPQVRIFSWRGHLKGQFFAYQKKFRGGVNVACGDLNGDGVDEIITGAGPGGGPHVRIFNSAGKVIAQFFGYQKNFHGGVYVASGK